MGRRVEDGSGSEHSKTRNLSCTENRNPLRPPTLSGVQKPLALDKYIPDQSVQRTLAAGLNQPHVSDCQRLRSLGF